MSPLVSKAELWLAERGLLAIGVAALLRWLLLFAFTRSRLPFTDNHLLAGALLVATLNLAGLYLPRSLAGIPQLLGLCGWLYALSLAQKYSFLWRTGERPDWLVYGALGLALVSFSLRWVMNRQWSAQIYGKGWAWIDNWASARSLRARVLAKQALVTLGYRRARLAGDSE